MQLSPGLYLAAGDLPPTTLWKRSLLITTCWVGPPLILTASLAWVPNYPGSWQISDGSADYCWQIQLSVKSASCLDEINSASPPCFFFCCCFFLFCKLSSRSFSPCSLTLSIPALGAMRQRWFLIVCCRCGPNIFSFYLCEKKEERFLLRCIK